jgi:hypothetical protein
MAHMLQWLTRRRRNAELERGASDLRTAARHCLDGRQNELLEVSVGTSSWPVRVCDISANGIEIVVGQLHEPDTILSARIEHTGREFAREVNLRVVHVIRRFDGYWITGCAFDVPLHPSEQWLLERDH